MKLGRLILTLALLGLFALGVAGAVPVRAQNQGASSCSPNIWYVASLNADIDPGAADFMATSVSSAQSACATHFVFVLTTNGGDSGSMESMVNSITSYEQWGGNFTTLIAPSGAYAFSAGSYIAEASNKIYMVPGTTIGSATPIISGIPTGEENSTMTKEIAAFTSYMKTLTGDNGRNDTAAGLMVSKGESYQCESLTNCMATQVDVVNGVLNATTLNGALSALGVPANTPINTPGIRSIFISVLSNPNVSSLLFLVGVFAVLFDIYHPTIILSVAGIALMALALLGLGIFGASVVAIALMVVGAAFIFLEVKTQHGVSALIGVVIFAVGFLLVFQSPPPVASPSAATPPQGNFFAIPAISYALLAIIAAAGILGSFYLVKVRKQLQAQPSHFDPIRMVGKQGRMESDVKPGGQGVAVIESEEWTVTSSETIPKGALVKVKVASGNRLVVDPA